MRSTVPSVGIEVDEVAAARDAGWKERRALRRSDGAARPPRRKRRRTAPSERRGPVPESQPHLITGMPMLSALSARLAVMPDPGNRISPFGRRFSSSSFRRNGAARPCVFQSGLHTTW